MFGGRSGGFHSEACEAVGREAAEGPHDEGRPGGARPEE